MPPGTYPRHAITLVGGDALCKDHAQLRARYATLQEAIDRADPS